MSRVDQPAAPTERSSVLFLAAACAAGDVEQVREVWRAARSAGEPNWYLDRIAAIGRHRSGAGSIASATASAGAA